MAPPEGEPTLDRILPPNPKLDEDDVKILIEMDGALSLDRHPADADDEYFNNYFVADEAIERAILYQDIHNSKETFDPLTGRIISAKEVAEYLRYLDSHLGDG